MNRRHFLTSAAAMAMVPVLPPMPHWGKNVWVLLEDGVEVEWGQHDGSGVFDTSYPMKFGATYSIRFTLT